MFSVSCSFAQVICVCSTPHFIYACFGYLRGKLRLSVHHILHIARTQYNPQRRSDKYDPEAELCNIEMDWCKSLPGWSLPSQLQYRNSCSPLSGSPPIGCFLVTDVIKVLTKEVRRGFSLVRLNQIQQF